MEKVYLTREGYDKLMAELKHLQSVVRKEVTLQIKEAREQGDLSENAEYSAAKEKQGRVEAKISQLENKLSRAEILKDDIKTDEIRIGVTVELENEDGDIFNYTLVDESEAEFSEGKISINAPIAQGLLGHKQGETVIIDIPSGKLNLKIISIKR